MSHNESLDPNSNYPPMSQSQWDSAPWNQSEPPERDFDILVSQTLSKSTMITTSDYIPEYDEEDGRTYANTEYTEWKQAFNDSGCYTPLELIEEFKKWLEEELPTLEGNKLRQAKIFIEECKDWQDDETEIVEE